MKNFFLIIAVVVGVSYGHHHFRNPAVIENPIYGEFRVELDVGPRKLTMLGFGKMSNEADCRERGERVWRDLVKNCTASRKADPHTLILINGST